MFDDGIEEGEGEKEGKEGERVSERKEEGERKIMKQELRTVILL